MWRSRNFWWLFGSFTSLLVLSLALASSLVVHRIESTFNQRFEDELRSKAFLVREVIEASTPKSGRSWQRQVEELARKTDTRITLISPDDDVLADSHSNPQERNVENQGHRKEVLQARRSGMGVVRLHPPGTGESPILFVAISARQPRGEVDIIRVSMPLDELEEQLAGLKQVMWTVAGVSVGASLLLACWLARRTIRPMQMLLDGAQHLASGDYGHKLNVYEHDDLAPVAQAFNHMSERLAAQFARIEEDRQQLRAVLSSMIEGVIAIDAEQRILFTNDRAETLLDIEKSAAGRKLWEVVRHRTILEIAQRVLDGPQICSGELDWQGPVSTRRLTLHAARLAGSNAAGAVLVVHDTTELRRLEQIRQEFVGNVSHELKTPLSVIKASVETLLDGAADDANYRDSFLKRIEEQADRLHALILDLLSLNRIESGTEVFDFQPVPLATVVLSAVDRQRGRAEAKKQNLLVMVPDGRGGFQPFRDATAMPDLFAWADVDAVSQILDNLIDNALKYTPEKGTITVRWFASGGNACLQVEDTGIGIPQADLPRIFERFYRVDKARSRELGGTGLGLAIVKHLTQAMRGSVQVRSEIGAGTTFTVSLPLASSSEFFALPSSKLHR